MGGREGLAQGGTVTGAECDTVRVVSTRTSMGRFTAALAAGGRRCPYLRSAARTLLFSVVPPAPITLHMLTEGPRGFDSFRADGPCCGKKRRSPPSCMPGSGTGVAWLVGKSSSPDLLSQMGIRLSLAGEVVQQATIRIRTRVRAESRAGPAIAFAGFFFFWWQAVPETCTYSSWDTRPRQFWPLPTFAPPQSLSPSAAFARSIPPSRGTPKSHQDLVVSSRLPQPAVRGCEKGASHVLWYEDEWKQTTSMRIAAFRFTDQLDGDAEV